MITSTTVSAAAGGRRRCAQPRRPGRGGAGFAADPVPTAFVDNARRDEVIVKLLQISFKLALITATQRGCNDCARC